MEGSVMKKALKITLIAVPVLIIVVLLVFLGSLNRIVKAGVETVGPKVTGTAVTLNAVKISPFSGQGALGGLLVGNPAGFKTDSAFELGQVRVNIDLKSLAGDKIVIEEIFIDGPKITFEGDLRGSNIAKIRQNVEAFSGGPGKAPAAEAAPSPETEKKPGKKVQIDRFVLKNGEIQLAATLAGGELVTVPLPDIELRDIGKDSGGATVEKVVNEVFPAIYKAITEAVLSSDKLLKEGVKTLEDAAKKAGEEAKEEASKVAEGLKGIFNR
jgi:hypothetical protein